MRLATGIVFWLLASFTEAMTLEDAYLLKKEFQLYQAWSLSRNYYFGMTLPRDRISSLAWQLSYLSHLPSTYPEKDKILLPYQANLTEKQRLRAQDLADSYNRIYHLGQPLSEAELYRLHELHQKEEMIDWNDYHPMIAPREVWSSFNRLNDWLIQNQQNEEARVLREKKDAMLNKRGTFVFGQIVIMGPESPAMVNTGLKPDAEGYFAGRIQESQLEFSLPGYKSVNVSIDLSKQIQGIGAILLKAPTPSKKTGMVGRVLPWGDLQQSNMILHFYPQKDRVKHDPWQDPALNLTLTPNGQFYATGLFPAHYQLIIATFGVISVKEFSVQENEIRGLSLIDLRKKIH